MLPRYCGYDITVVELKIIGYNRNSICSNFSYHVHDIICVKSKCKAHKLDTINNLDLFQEAVWCIVPLKRTKSFLVGIQYRSTRSCKSNDTILMDLLNKLRIWVQLIP